MARPLRIEFPGAYYHVINRGQSRRDNFLEDKGRQSFLDLLGELGRLWSVEIYAYCLMNNHYHLLLSTPKGALARAMRHLGGVYTQKFNRVHDRDGPLFRGRYKAILIDAEEHFLSVVRYIHQNPVAAGMVTDMDRYRWSSHWGYLNKRQRSAWLDTRAVLSRFRGIQGYQQFMHDKVEKEIEDFYRGQNQKPILGSKAFIEQVIETLGDKARVAAEIPESREIFAPEIEEIVKATAREYGLSVEAMRKRGAGDDARTMAIYLSRELGGHRQGEIGKAVGLAKTSSVSSAYLRMKAMVARDRALARRARKVKERLTESKKRT